MKAFYFTFGQGHAHDVNGHWFDKDQVVQIEAADYSAARKVMFDTFGDKWAFQYDDIEKVHIEYYRLGVVDINGKAVKV